jgi:tetratricopeptide (TPR) repeat protein
MWVEGIVVMSYSTHNVCFNPLDWLEMPASLGPKPPSELPHDSGQLIKLGEQYLNSRLILEAELCFVSALAINPGLSEAYYWLGYLYSRQGRYEQAALELRNCLAAQPRNGYAYAELGLVYFKLAHIREARALWQQGIMLTSGSVQPLTELLQHMSFYVTLDGENRVIPNLCSMATLTATKDVDLAYSYLERAYILEPYNPAIFASLAALFGADGREDEAGLAWEEAVRLCPEDPDLQAKVAAYYLGRGKTEQAKSRAEKAVELAPNNASYRLLLAQAEERLNNVRAAETHLRMAHKLEPEQTDINFELGRLLWSHVKSPAGLSFLVKAARAGHDEAQAFLTMINIDRGRKRLFSRTDRGGTVFEHTAY